MKQHLNNSENYANIYAFFVTFRQKRFHVGVGLKLTKK